MKQGKKAKGKADVGGEAGEANGDKVLQRYYHLYCKGELEDDMVTAGGVVVESGYEKDNWWAVAKRADD